MEARDSKEEKLVAHKRHTTTYLAIGSALLIAGCALALLTPAAEHVRRRLQPPTIGGHTHDGTGNGAGQYTNAAFAIGSPVVTSSSREATNSINSIPDLDVGTSTASFDQWASITCYKAGVVTCDLMLREGPGFVYEVGKMGARHGDDVDYLTTFTKSTSVTATISFATTVEAVHPQVQTFDASNALVCWTAIPARTIDCASIKFVPRDSHVDHTLTSGPVLSVHSTGGINQFALDTFDGRGAPPDWAARRAILCYTDYSARRSYCQTISLSFPLLS